MRAMLCILALVPTILAQDDVQVDCTPDHMEIRVTKGKDPNSDMRTITSNGSLSRFDFCPDFIN